MRTILLASTASLFLISPAFASCDRNWPHFGPWATWECNEAWPSFAAGGHHRNPVHHKKHPHPHHVVQPKPHPQPVVVTPPAPPPDVAPVAKPRQKLRDRIQQRIDEDFEDLKGRWQDWKARHR